MSERLAAEGIYSRLSLINNQVILNNTVTTVNWDSVPGAESTDKISPSVANNETVIDVAGLYIVQVSCHWDGPTATSAGTSKRRMIRIQQDTGSGYSDLRYPSFIECNQNNGSDTSQSVMFIQDFDKGHKLRVQVHQGAGESITLLGNTPSTHFKMVKLPIHWPNLQSVA